MSLIFLVIFTLKEENVVSMPLPLHNKVNSLTPSICSASASSCFHGQSVCSSSPCFTPPLEFAPSSDIQEQEASDPPTSFSRCLIVPSFSRADCSRENDTPSPLNVRSSPRTPIPPVFEAPLDVCQDQIIVLHFHQGTIINLYASNGVEGTFDDLSSCTNSAANATIEDVATTECCKHNTELDRDKLNTFLQFPSCIFPPLGAESAPFPFVVGQSYLAFIDAEHSSFKGLDFWVVGHCVDVLCSDAQEQRKRVNANTSARVIVASASLPLPPLMANQKSPLGRVIHGTVTHTINTVSDPKWVALRLKLLDAESTICNVVEGLIQTYSILVQLKTVRITYDGKVCFLNVRFFSTDSLEREKAVGTLFRKVHFLGKYAFNVFSV